MSEPTFEGARPIDKCSVKLTRNAKGDTQVELKVVEGADADEVARIRTLALNEYREAVTATGGMLP